MPNRRLNTSGIGVEKQKQVAVHRTHRIGRRNSVSDQYSNGTAIVKVDTGPYVYQYFQMSLVANAAIAGETISKDGVHYVKTSSLSKYIKSVTLEIDGTPERKHQIVDMVKRNAWLGHDAIDGFLFMLFGGPHEFTNSRAEDAYMLATANLRTVRLHYELTNEWVQGGMQIKVLQEYAHKELPLEFIQTTKTFRANLATAGPNSILDIPANADIARIFLFGDGISDVELVIDDQTVFDCHSYELQAINGLFGANLGRDITQLGNCVLFDFWRDQEFQKALSGLRTEAQNKRNASIALNFTTLNANTEVRIEVDVCGRYVTQG